jgi:hypothetical protein
MKPDPWDDEQRWTEERYSPAYVAYLRVTLPPTQASEGERNQARQALQWAPMVEVILSQQMADGSWPLGGPPWFRVSPIPLQVLLEHELQDHPAVQSGLRYLFTTLADGRFRWPRHEPHDPKEYYVAYQGWCLQVMARAGLASDPRVQDVASTLFNRQRWDGGWGTKPEWMFRPDEPRLDPRPSCWICTLEAMRGLGRVLSLPPDASRRLFSFWTTVLRVDETDAMVTPLGTDFAGVILACLEFCATQGLRSSAPPVRQFLSYLDTVRGRDGHFPRLSDYYDVMSGHLTWRLTSSGQLC